MKWSQLNEWFIDAADWISHAMGTPGNIIFWIFAVLGWILLFATHPELQNTAFLPAWFTSNAFNFPLNTVTTLAELYIGFLVAAAANRVERNNQALQMQQMQIIQHIESTSQTEEQDIAKAEQDLMQEDERMIEIMRHLDKQDDLILQIVQRLDAEASVK